MFCLKISRTTDFTKKTFLGLYKMLLAGTKNSFTTRGLEDASLIITALKGEAEGQGGAWHFSSIENNQMVKDKMKCILHFYSIGCIRSKFQPHQPKYSILPNVRRAEAAKMRNTICSLPLQRIVNAF